MEVIAQNEHESNACNEIKNKFFDSAAANRLQPLSRALQVRSVYMMTHSRSPEVSRCGWQARNGDYNGLHGEKIPLYRQDNAT